MSSNCMASSSKVLRQCPCGWNQKPSASSDYPPSFPTPFLYCVTDQYLLLCGFWLALTNGGPRRDKSKGRKWDWDIYSLASSPREEACILMQERMHPSQGSLLDKTPSSQVPVIMPFPGPMGSKGGNSSAMTSTILTFWFFTLTNTFSIYWTLHIILIWRFYVGIFLVGIVIDTITLLS